MADPSRRALSIAIGSFTDPELKLAFAPGLGEGMRSALTELGYECLSPPADLSGEAIDAAVRQAIDSTAPDGLLLIHLISHAELRRTGTVYVLGSDERRVTPLDWIRSVEDGPGPLTLFLLDVCHAGEAARPSWQGDLADGSARAWVIGATTPRDAAYDGRFTRAVVNVIDALRRGELDLDATLREVPFVTIARAIGQEVKRLVDESGGYAQQATGSLLDVTALPPRLPFFPNPTARPPSATQRARAEVDVAIRPFLDDVDEALDATHFFERAAGGPQVTAGCFSGRVGELRDLVPWMQGYGEGPLRVVTGSPGVGKSALLGVLVCAAHPRLRAPTAEVWKKVELAPWPIRRLAAVHARRRAPEEITASLARQLGIGAENLVAEIAAADEIPVVVLDALDEADRPEEIMRGLLLPLAQAVREDGRPAVRLLVGTRRWGFEPLLDLARDGGGLVDLDEVDRDVLYDEIEKYVLELLRADPAYRSRGAVRGAFAAEAAAALSAPPEPGQERWGEFLVAGLYARHFISGPEVTDPAKAAELGGRVPRTLPEVFALDFADGANAAEARSLLTVLAYAAGEGMPLALAARGAAATGAPSLTLADRDRWDAALFYLRRATDVDGTTLYRVFHEGLSEHLRDADDADAPIYAALLAPLDSPQGRRWDLAEPYLLRHAPDHAHAAGALGGLLDDLGFLVHCDPVALATIAKLDPSRADTARLLAASPSPDERRRALTMAAVRTGDIGLAGRLSVSPGGARLSWRPVWVSRHAAAALPESSVRLLGRLDGHKGAVNTVAITRLGGATVAFTGGEDETIRVWDLTTRTQRDVFRRTGPVYDLSVARDGDGPLVFFCDRNGGLKARGLDPKEIRRLGGGTVVRAVDAGEFKNAFTAVSGAGNGDVEVWERHGGAFRSRPLADHGAPVESVALGERPSGMVYAVVGGRTGGVSVHPLEQDHPRSLLLSPDPVYAIATGILDGRSIILTGGAGSQRLRLWDERTGEQLGLLDGHTNTVFEAAIGELGDRVIAVTGGGDDTVRFWDLATRTQFTEPRRDHASTVYAVALGEVEGELVAVTGARDGSVCVWRLGDAGRSVLVGACHAEGVPLALLRGPHGAISVADLRTGTVVETLSTAGYGGVPVDVRTVVVADRPMPALRFSNGSVALWEPGGGLVHVNRKTVPGLSSPDQVTVIRDGRLHRVDSGEDVTAMVASQLTGHTVLYTADGRTVRVGDVETGTTLDAIEAPGEIRALRADPAGYVLVETAEEVICFAHSSVTA